MIMTERLKKAVDKYIECGDKKEALAFGEYHADFYNPWFPA